METKTYWEDSGRDCSFCGGKIYKRTDEEPTRLYSYYQCQQCGAQWSLDNELLRAGTDPEQIPPTPLGNFLDRLNNRRAWTWAVVGVLLLAVILRSGVAFFGVLIVRLLVPVIFLLIAGGILYYFGRSMKWWE